MRDKVQVVPMEWKWNPSDDIFANTRLRKEPEALKLGPWASQAVTSQVVRAKQDLISLGSTSPQSQHHADSRLSGDRDVLSQHNTGLARRPTFDFVNLRHCIALRCAFDDIAWDRMAEYSRA